MRPLTAQRGAEGDVVAGADQGEGHLHLARRAVVGVETPGQLDVGHPRVVAEPTSGRVGPLPRGLVDEPHGQAGDAQVLHVVVEPADVRPGFRLAWRRQGQRLAARP